MTEAQLAAYRGISVKTLRLVRTGRGMTNEEICAIPGSKLARAIARAEHPKPDHAGEAVAFRLLQLQDENGFIPPDGLSAAAQHVKLMKAAQPDISQVAGITGETWTSIGPGNIGGRVRSILIHPATPAIMWLGSVSGGIWKTTNGGASWQVVDDFMTNLAVSTLVMDPTNSNIMYAGTGEGFYNGDSIRGAGVFKSINGGTTWSHLPSTANSNWYSVNRLVLSPNGLTLLAATGSGIWRSTDGGNAWTETSTDDYVKDLDFDPTSSDNAIASGSFGRAYYSTNGGVTWTPAAGLPVLDWLGRVELAYAPGSRNIVYASVSRNSGEVWRSVDGGQSYSLVNTGTNYLGGQGWYDNIVWVDPTNANTLIVGGIDLWRSTNGGTNLSKISQWYSAPISAHADHHFIIQHPNFNGSSNTTVYFGNDGGIYKTDNVYTVSLTTGWQELNNNLAITQFYGAAGNEASQVIVGGTQDNGTLRYAGGSESWTTMFGGDGGWCGSDPNDPNYFYGEYVYLYLHRSTNGGVSSDWIYSGLGDSGSNANFIAPFILDPNNSNTLLAGGASLWRSTNVKAPIPSWSAVKLSVGSVISAIAVAPGNSNIIWVGHNNGDVYKTVDGATATPAWTREDLNAPNLPNRFVTRITVDPQNSEIVYVTFGGFSPDNVWRTSDGGNTWSDATGLGATGLPSVPVRSLVVHPSNSNWIYAGTEVGIFASQTSGATWSVPQDGPANVSVDELFWVGPSLVAATYGRGLFKTAPLLCNTPGSFSLSSPSNGQSFGSSTTSVPLSWSASSNADSYDVYFGTSSNPPFLANQTATSRSVSVTDGQTYYWKVVAIVNCNSSYTSTAGIWSFSVNQPPSIGTLNPASGTSAAEAMVSFKTTYTDANGYAQLATGYFLVNTALSGTNAAYGYYNQNSNAFYWRNDANTASLGPCTPGHATVLENGYTKLNCAASTVSGSGTTLTVTWNVTFKTPFVTSAVKNVYLLATDDAGASSGWVQKGTWLVGPNTAPAVGTLTPASGTSAADAMASFKTTYTDANGYSQLATGYLLVNTALSGTNAAYGYYNQNANTFYWRNDTNTASLGPCTPGQATVLENSYSKLNCAASTVSGSGTTLTVTWNVMFKTPFVTSAVKNIYLLATDDAGASSGWVQKGTWLVGPNTAPAVGTLTPASGTSAADATASFKTTYTDANGVAQMATGYFLVNTALSGTNAAYGYYNQNANTFYWRNDANTASLGPCTPGQATVLENSFSKLNCAASTVSGSGTTLIVTWNVTFKTPFVTSAVKNIYLIATDDAGASSGWVQMGTWLVGPNTAPAVGTLAPASGTSAADAMASFTTTYTDANGYGQLATGYFLVNTTLSGTNAAYGYYNQNANSFYWRNDADTASLGPCTPGQAAVLENSYAKLHCNVSTVSGSGTTLTVTWKVTFKTPFVTNAVKNIYLLATDDAGASSGWVQKGTWLVGSNTAPAVGTLTPASGTSAADAMVSFTTTYTDANGYPETATRRYDVRKPWVAARKAGGYPWLRVRDLCPSFGIEASEGGVPIHFIQSVLGLGSVAVTERYYAKFRPAFRL